MPEYVPTMNDVKHWLCEPPYAGGLFDDETAAKFDVALAAHDAEVAAKAVEGFRVYVAAEIEDYLSIPTLHVLADDYLRARAAEYRKAVQS